MDNIQKVLSSVKPATPIDHGLPPVSSSPSKASLSFISDPPAIIAPPITISQAINSSQPVASTSKPYVQALPPSSDVDEDIEMRDSEADILATDGVDGDLDDEDGDDDQDGGNDEEGSDSDEDEDEDEEDDESSGDESEDLEGTPEISAVVGPDGMAELKLPINMKIIKSEPTDATQSSPTAVDGVLEGTEGETNILVPKKKRKQRRSPSTDEDLPPPPPPMKTIRLERPLPIEGPGGIETLHWNILDEAREKGMVAVWGEGEDVESKDPIGLGDSAGGAGVKVDGPAESGLGGLLGGDMDAEEIARRLEEKYGDKPKKAKKIQKRKVDYDLEDPFIDDSELMIDAPTHYQRPKKEGFFVHMGPLELLEASPIKAKPRAQPRQSRVGGPSNITSDTRSIQRKSLAELAVASRRTPRSSVTLGSQSSPIKIDSDSEGEEGGTHAGPSKGRSSSAETEPMPIALVDLLPLDRGLYKNASRDPNLLPPFPNFPPELANRLMIVRQASEKVGWNPNERQKFPESIKPLLTRAGQAAYEADFFPVSPGEDTRGKELFDALPSVLPYNKFTLTKLITKLCYDGYRKWLIRLETIGLEQLRVLVKADEAMWIQKYEEAMNAWREQMKDWDEKHAQGGTGTQTETPQIEPEVIDVDADENEPVQAATDGSVKPREPARRFTWTPEMRGVLSQLLDNMQTMVDLNKRMEEHKAAFIGQTNDINLKRELYKKICECFPEGFMNSTVVSRESSKLKKRAQVTEG